MKWQKIRWLSEAEIRNILTRHKVSDHKPAMEDTNRNKTVTGEVETEMHFLLRCKLLSDVRTTYFNQFRSVFQWAKQHDKIRSSPRRRTRGLSGCPAYIKMSEDQDWRTPARVVLYSCLLNWVEIKWTDTDTVFSVDIFWYISKLYVYCEWMNIECCHVPFLNGAITWFSYICRYGCLPTAMSTSTVCPALSSMEVPQHLGSVILNQPMGRGLFWPWDLQAIPSTDVQFPVPCMPSLLACCTLLICAGSCQ